MDFFKKYTVTLLAIFFSANLFSQATATVVGTMTGEENEPLVGATINIKSTGIGVSTNSEGKYSIAVPAGRSVTLIYSYLGYLKIERTFTLEKGESVKIDVPMVSNAEIGTVEIRDEFTRSELGGLMISPKDIEKFPSTTGSLEQVIQFLAPGVSAGPGGELTSQYSVRGGNYDENLVYVNGFEIYRPLLVRNGQQEGLSFPNPNLVRGFTFSSGGFAAQYGDKMSSVLDIRYKRPTKFGASVEGSFLGASAHIEGAVIKKKDRGLGLSNPQRLSYLIGARYKTTKYLLNSLDVTGEFVPTFLDLQADVTYDISRRWQLELIGNYNYSKFNLMPQSLRSTLGLFNYALQLVADFDGGEVDDFKTSMAGTSVTWQPNENMSWRLAASAYQTHENERRDIVSYYRLEEIQSALGSENFGEVIGTLGYGETQQYIRNYLHGQVGNLNLTGSYDHKKETLYFDNENKSKTRFNNHYLQWGAKYQYETIDDKIKEWERIDSLGYTVPFNNTIGTPPAYEDSELSFQNVIKTHVNLQTSRLNGFFQDTWTIKDPNKEIRFNFGLRAAYSDLNKEGMVTPRAQFFYSPVMKSDSGKVKSITYKLSAGAYYQPPYYRELRNLAGEVNTNVRAQKSLHLIGGIATDFIMFKRPFKFIGEVYGKYMWDLVPYDLDNVRIRYYGKNNAKGYVTGVDLRLNGELADGVESWVNLSVFRAREHFTDTSHVMRNLGDTTDYAVYDVPRPTDQAFIFSMYFQDYLPKARWLTVSMALSVGAGIPFGIPNDNIKYRNVFRMRPYHRIDIGFNAALWDKKRWEKRKGAGEKTKNVSPVLKHFQRAWLSFEVFNLMEVSNQASQTWVKDFYNRSFAIPNYLTSRRINVRLRAEF